MTRDEASMPAETSEPAESTGSDPHRSTICFDRFRMVVGGRRLLWNYNASIPADGLTVVVGPSGAGKSLWLRAVAGLIDRRQSAIEVQGDVSVGDRIDPRIGVVFQSYAVFDELTPRQNVQIALDHRPTKTTPHRTESADAHLAELDIPSDVPTRALSGGQKQRLGIARALASQPDVVLYDEPTSGLDGQTAGRVAELIRRTHHQTGVPGIVVTHDYVSVLPVADRVLLFDVAAASLIEVPPTHWGNIAEWIGGGRTGDVDAKLGDAPEREDPGGDSIIGSWLRRIDGIGRAVRGVAGEISTLSPVPTSRWMVWFLGQHLRLVAGPSAIVYLMAAGGIVGFVTIYFTLDYLPYKRTTGPLLIDDLIAAVGFALYRVLIPILATVLIAARSGAALAASVGVKRYGGQIDAMKTIGVEPQRHLGGMMVAAMIVSTPLLVLLAYISARAVAAATFATMFPEVERSFWDWHIRRGLIEGHATAWLIAKSVVCGLAVAIIASIHGNAPKDSAAAVSRSITACILWSTLVVLATHFGFALVEF